MDIQKTIKDLGARSGKTFKWKVQKIIELSFGNDLFHLALLIAQDKKVCLILNNSQYTTSKIEENKWIFSKNLQFCTTVEGIPVFKLARLSSIKESKSRVEAKNLLHFDENEFQKFEVSNLSEFFETSPGPSNSQVEIENEEQKEKYKSVLTLTEFLETKSSNITDNQFVEVS